MLSNRIAYNVLIQSKLVANYNKPREGGVVLTPGKTNYAKYFCKKFRRFTQKPMKSTNTTHRYKHYDNHPPKFNRIVCEFSNIFL